MLYNGHIFTNKHGERFRRVNKTEARNRAARGETVGVCACNLDPFNPYYNPCTWYHPKEERLAFDGYNTFDAFVNAYEYYSCSPEAGRYASFYVTVNDNRKEGTMSFENHDTPGQIANRAISRRYNLQNTYTGETFENIGADDVEEKLLAWLHEDGYEFGDHEQWYDYIWAEFAPGYIVEAIDE